MLQDDKHLESSTNMKEDGGDKHQGLQNGNGVLNGGAVHTSGFQYKRLGKKSGTNDISMKGLSKHPAAFITPVVVLSVSVVLLIIAFSAADWNKSPEIRTSTGPPAPPISVATSTSTTAATTSTAVTTTTSTVTTTTTSSGTVTTTDSTTIGDLEATTDSSKLVAYSFEIVRDEEFTAEYLDSSSVLYISKSQQVCESISRIFNSTSIEFEGCLTTSIQNGSLKLSVTVVLMETDSWIELTTAPPSSNLTNYEYTVEKVISDGLSDLGVAGLMKQNVTFTESCSECEMLEKTTRDMSIGCRATDLCSNSSFCVNGPNGYSCLCDDEHYGENCNLVVSDCAEDYCNSRGSCIRQIYNEGIYCECTGGYSGDHCEVEPPVEEKVTYPCANFTTPCSDHGTCYDLNQTQYLCVCNAGYNGKNCEEDINECASDPCFHGNCTDKVNGFTCDCDDGYGGIQCQIDIDHCLPNPCPENSRCINLVDNYTCLCDIGYTGHNCTSICDDDPCFNNATCSLCPDGLCNGTGLPFQCNCTGSEIYGALCTDRNAGWSEWSEWDSRYEVSLQRMFGLDVDLTIANCSYINHTRTRNCTVMPLGSGKTCEGPPEEVGQLTEVDCRCTSCCEGLLPCLPAIQGCFCNEDCISTCCPNRTDACMNTVPYTPDMFLSP